MKCPVCGKEMESGYVQGERMAAWVKRRHKLSLLPKEGEILLANHLFGAYLFPGYICRNCRQITFAYDPDETGYRER